LTACASTPKSGTASLRTSNGAVLVGSVSEHNNSGSIHLTGSSGLNCHSNYQFSAGETNPIVPIQCSDGRVGVGSFQRISPGNAIARVTFQDGSSGQIGVGSYARSVIEPPALASQSVTSADNSTNLNPTPALSPDVSSEGPVVTPAPTPSPSFGGAGGYGAISTVTGLARTEPVSGYFRSNGTYVRPYYRSRR
jgi:hypothetical protein